MCHTVLFSDVEARFLSPAFHRGKMKRAGTYKPADLDGPMDEAEMVLRAHLAMDEAEMVLVSGESARSDYSM